MKPFKGLPSTNNNSNTIATLLFLFCSYLISRFITLIVYILSPVFEANTYLNVDILIRQSYFA